MAVGTRPGVKMRYKKAVVDAWSEYLAQTRALDGARYGEVEPWAWAELCRRLRDAGVSMKDG